MKENRQLSKENDNKEKIIEELQNKINHLLDFLENNNIEKFF